MATGTLTVTLHEDENVRSWLTQAGATDPNDKLEGAYAEYSRSTVLGASMDGGKTIIPLYIAPDGSQMVGKLDFPVSTEDDVTHVVEFFELQDGNPITSGEGEDAKPLPFFGMYTSFVAQQAVILGEGGVTFTTPADWPKEEGQRVFGDQLTAPFTLSFTVVDQSATWKDTSKVTIRDTTGGLVDEDAHFLWESSNPQVATINEKGEITILTNGAVSFTLTALNGNVEKTPADPPQEATTYAYTYATPEILVGVGNSPFLTVPESLRTTTVRGGQPATVLWSSNLTEKNRDNAAGEEDLDSVETTFTLTLYKAGDFDESAGGPKEGAQGEALDPVVSSMKDVKSSALIPADKIPYAKVYDFNTEKWSGPYTLYNGTSGAVKGMEAQMTESGAMAVAYTIEKGSTSSTTRAVTLEDGTTEITSNLQTVFALIQPDATEGYKVAKNVQVTDDKDVNENPQLTAVKFDGEAEESFILGWHSVHSADGEENNDIRLMAFTEDGTLRGDLVDSISAISSQTGSSITSNFRFAKGTETLDELSILWSQPTMEVDEESTTPENNLGTADSDVLMGVRFRMDNGTIGLTAPIQLAALEEQETTSKTIEAFDGWVQSYGSLKAVALSTEYGVVDPDTELTYHIELVPGVDNEGNSTGELTEVAIQNSQTNLVSVTGSYTDAIAAEVPVPDYQALAVGASVPVQTTVTNLGTQPIISIDFQVGGESQQAPVVIQPGESATVTTNYTVVETAEGNGVLANPDYTVTATFGSGTTARAAASTGTINLNVPNLGISTFETVQQEDGKRVLRFSLYNNSAAQLENSGRTVKVGLCSDPECTMPIESQYASFSPVSTGTRANGAEFTIDSTTDLAAIDQGAYAGQITMDLAAYAKSDPENYMENGEIRSGGVTVDVTFIPEDWPFVDVTEDKWYYDAVAYVYQQGIMVGMSETTFEPNTTVNRTQVVQMLYNLEGQPQVSGDSGFSDIRDGQWYAKAVAWASANDVVAGYEDGTFRPTRAVTREEFAQILYNYAKFKGYDLSASADLGKFPDSGQVSSWAGTALGWANGNGLINGHDDGRLDPKGSTIRAQAASILMNFDKGFAQEG